MATGGAGIETSGIEKTDGTVIVATVGAGKETTGIKTTVGQ